MTITTTINPAQHGELVLRSIKQLCLTSLGACVTVLGSCATAPDLPASEWPDAGRRIAGRMGPQLLNKSVTDHVVDIQNRVEAALASLAKQPEFNQVVSGYRDMKAETIILADKQVDHVSIIGGQIVLTEGLLGQIKNDAQLAGVLAYELLWIRSGHQARAWKKYRDALLPEWKPSPDATTTDADKQQQANVWLMSVALEASALEPNTSAQEASAQRDGASKPTAAFKPGGYDRDASLDVTWQALLVVEEANLSPEAYLDFLGEVLFAPNYSLRATHSYLPQDVQSLRNRLIKRRHEQQKSNDELKDGKEAYETKVALELKQMSTQESGQR